MTLRALVLLPLFALLALVLAPVDLHAEPIWARLITGQKVEADPNAEYKLTDNQGPWIIIATTFSGGGAADQSRELVLELRKRYKLEAYTHEKTFDFTGT